MRKYVFLAWLCLLPFAGAADAPKVPAEKELKALALGSLLSFNKAVQAKDFTEFHGQISALWRKQVTPAELKTSFQTFIDQHLDIASIKSADPTFSEPPKIDSDGVLVVTGSYPTMPMKVDFRVKYLNESGAWKLVGIKVDTKPAGAAGTLPTDAAAKALARQSLLAFNSAIRAKSFVEFHKQIAVMWQKQVTPERLAELFAPFVKAGVDLGAIATTDPTFDTPPAINADGLLEVHGTFPTPAASDHFDLTYLFEAPDWKLVGINVNLKPLGSEASPSPKPDKAKKDADDDDDDDDDSSSDKSN